MLNFLIDSIDIKKMKLVYSSAILTYTKNYKGEIRGWKLLYDSSLKESMKEVKKEEENYMFFLNNIN